MTWRLLYVRPLAERRVIAALTEARLESYLPIERVWRGIGGRRREHDRPLLPSMLFANLPDDDDLLAFVKHEVEGVARVVSPTGDDVKALADFVATLQTDQASGDYDKTASKTKALKVGDRVRVARGQFAGLSGAIVGMSTKRRVQLVTSLFGREGRMTVEADKLEVMEEQAGPANAPGRQKFAA